MPHNIVWYSDTPWNSQYVTKELWEKRKVNLYVAKDTQVTRRDVRALWARGLAYDYDVTAGLVSTCDSCRRQSPLGPLIFEQLPEDLTVDMPWSEFKLALLNYPRALVEKLADRYTTRTDPGRVRKNHRRAFLIDLQRLHNQHSRGGETP